MLDTHFLLLKYSQFLSFQCYLNFCKSDVKMYFCNMYGARENLYEFRVTDDI